MQGLTRSFLITALGFEAAFLGLIGCGIAPTMAGNWVAFGWMSLLNALFLLISFGMLWSELFAESWNKAMGESPNPKISPKQVRIKCAKIVTHPVMIAANLALMFLVRK